MPPMPTPRPGPAPKGPGTPPKADSPAAKLYKQQKGFANFHFNEVQRDKLLAAVKKHGDFSAAATSLIGEGTYDQGVRKGEVRFEVTQHAEDPTVALRMNIDQKLNPLKKNADLRELTEPINSGGLMMALYHYHRFLALGAEGFEGEFVHGGSEPLYPPKADGSTPKSLAELRVDTDVIRTRHGSVSCKWYFAKADHRLIGLETTVSKEIDPCEVFFADYKDVGGGRSLPHRIEVHHNDKRYAVLTINKFTLK
jgi:serine protease Do